MRTTAKERDEVVTRILRLGISLEHAHQLRRISMTLRNWFELECGTGDGRVTRSIERDDNGEGKPFLRVQFATAKGWVDRKHPVPDREKGARKRLASVMAHYPALISYVQGDCRGASVHLLRAGVDLKPGEDVNSVYSRGVAVY